jgi:hypothetical protein
VAAHGVHLLKGRHASPTEMALLLGGFVALFPGRAFFYYKVDVFGRGGIELVAAQAGAVAIETENGLCRLLEHDGFKVEVGDAVEAAGAAQVEIEVVYGVFVGAEIAFCAPAHQGFGPKAFGCG